jgi:hypothetical protein
MPTSTASKSNDLLIVSAPSAVPALSEALVPNDLDDMAGTDTVVETGHALATSLRTSEHGNDRGDRFVELAAPQAVTADITFIEIDPIVPDTSRHKEERAGGLKADSNEVAVESLTGREDDIPLDPAGFNSVIFPNYDGVILLHGDFSSLVDSEPAVAAATEELVGDDSFIRIEPAAPDVGQESGSSVSYEIGNPGDSLVEMPVPHGDTASPADTHTEQLLGAYNFVVAEPAAPDVPGMGAGGDVSAFLHGDFSTYVTNGTSGTVSYRGNDAKIANISDGTSNTILFAENSVVESVAVKYTLSGAERDDLLPVDAALDLNDLFIGDAALDLNAVDNGNDVQRENTPDGGASIHAHGDGQANGIIAVLIGVTTDSPGQVDNASLALD